MAKKKKSKHESKLLCEFWDTLMGNDKLANENRALKELLYDKSIGIREEKFNDAMAVFTIALESEKDKLTKSLAESYKLGKEIENLKEELLESHGNIVSEKSANMTLDRTIEKLQVENEQLKVDLAVAEVEVTANKLGKRDATHENSRLKAQFKKDRASLRILRGKVKELKAGISGMITDRWKTLNTGNGIQFKSFDEMLNDNNCKCKRVEYKSHGCLHKCY